MTHFTVLVAVPEDGDLESILAPFDENSDDPEYQDIVLIMEDELESYLKDFEEKLAESEEPFTFNEYMADIGFKFFSDYNAYGYTTGAESKWDWWEIGGRWQDYFGAVKGSVEDFEFGRIQQERIERAMETYDAFWEARNRLSVTAEDIEEAKKKLAENSYVFAHWQDASELALDLKAFSEAIDSFMCGYNDLLEIKNPSREEYYNKNFWCGLTHAIVDEKGDWHERGQMGWFARCNDENADNFDGENGEFWTLIKTLSPTSTLYLVDCHI